MSDEDEDFWVAHRKDLFGPQWSSLKDVLPKAFRGSSACLVDNMGAANIRTYLPIYRRVLLVAPLSGQHERMLAELRITQAELLELMRLGRVQLVCPQSLDRYPPALINAAAEAAPDAVLLSRRLAASSVIDARHRMLLVPGCDIDQRRRMLQDLHEAAARAEGDIERKILAANLAHFRQAWLRAEDLFNTHGAMATLWIGIGPVMARIVQEVWDTDGLLEIGAAGQNVVWAGALGATLFPVETETYSSQLWSELCASGYTGVQQQSVPVNFGKVEPVVEGLLGIENDADVVEFARAFDASDVDRFRQIVVRLAEHNLDPDFLNVAVEALNARVRAYESRVERQARFDAVTAVSVFAGAAAAVAGEQALTLASGCIPPGAWLAVRLTSPAGGGSAWRDTLRAINARTSRDAVLVSRLRRALRRD